MNATREDLANPRSGDRPVHPTTVSFRDPNGRVVIADGRAFRVVDPDYQETITEFLGSRLSSELVDNEMLINTRIVNEPDLREQLIQIAMPQRPHAMVLEHEHIAFPSYPYEWPPEMLYAAGELTLDLMERLLPETLVLKDASPYNILYRGPKPIFIDFLSIEKRAAEDSTWLAYAQFTRTFISPLLADKYFGVRLDQTFRIYRDGLQPEQVFRMSSMWRKLHPALLTTISLPALLSRMNPNRYQKIYQPRLRRSPELASFILERQLRGLRRKLKAAKPIAARTSSWHDYEEQEAQKERNLPGKKRFVERALNEHRPGRVLDIGCNRGFFSLLTARAGCSVIAIDQDPVVVGQLWRRATQEKLDVLPLVTDITRPTAGLGWRNTETLGFLDRARGSFQCVMMLAVIHHMLVTERIPLDEILKLAWELTTDLLVIEFVPPQDSMFRLITRGNDRLYGYLNRDLFEDLSSKYFVIERTEKVADSERRLYQMRRARLA
jgi:SAM-dependent methyltransferase